MSGSLTEWGILFQILIHGTYIYILLIIQPTDKRFILEYITILQIGECKSNFANVCANMTDDSYDWCQSRLIFMDSNKLQIKSLNT